MIKETIIGKTVAGLLVAGIVGAYALVANNDQRIDKVETQEAVVIEKLNHIDKQLDDIDESISGLATAVQELQITSGSTGPAFNGTEYERRLNAAEYNIRRANCLLTGPNWSSPACQGVRR